MNTQNKPQAFEVNNTAGRTYWGMGVLWTMLVTASMPLPDLEQTNRSMAEIIKKYPAAKTNFLQGYDG